MSSKRNKNRRKNNSQKPVSSSTTEKLTEQLNNNDDNTAEQTEEDDILIQYEKKAAEAEKRIAERRRKAEEEAKKQELAALKAEKNAQRRKLLEEQFLASVPAEKTVQQPQSQQNTEEVPSPENDSGSVHDDSEADVKQFVPRIQKQSEDISEDDRGTINDALSENSEVLDEPSAQDEGEDEAAAVKERPNRFYLVFAVFVIIMSVIGVISVTKSVIGFVSDIANQTELKNEIALFLYPVVTVDPPDCDTVDELPPTIIVESAIWRIILTGDNTNYEKLYNTYMYVPAIDVEFSVRSIFGNSVKIEHQTVGTMDMTFTYNEENNSYLVPINPHYTAYSPRITELSNVGELYTVTVEYIPPSALVVEGIDFEVTPAKTIIYTMSKSRNSATIHSIKNITRFENTYEY